MDARVKEFHCIMPIVNIASVMANGLLSYERAAKLPHASVALQPVQEKHDVKQVPRGLKLHQYANLYFDARNPMMFLRRGSAPGLCVLRCSTNILDVEGVVLADQNAASDYVRFLHPSQWKALPFDDIFANDWRSPDLATYYRQKARRCAELLVPDRVPPAYFIGAYVVDAAAVITLKQTGFQLPVAVNANTFFR